MVISVRYHAEVDRDKQSLNARTQEIAEEFYPIVLDILNEIRFGKEIVSENVKVTALLSDQDLPLQPEGTTEEINDLDKSS
jgi:mRNA-degrading endonuclease RelE of RelBE toxin-antitoxin system